MKCIKCGTDFATNFCPNCGTSSVASLKNGGKLLGFRSNVGWKKVLSICYLIFTLLAAVIMLTEAKKGQITTYDHIIIKLTYVIELFILISPYIFLSNTKLRNTLPFFNKRTTKSSLLGMIIVIFGLSLVGAVITSLHSIEYSADMDNHAYVIVSPFDATDPNNGEIVYRCSYCGLEKIESTEAAENNMDPTDNLSREEISPEETPPLSTEGTETSPYIFTADELFTLSTDENFQSKYLDKWVQVSGTILSISDYTNLKGYYLTGGPGNGVVCWIDSNRVEAQHGQNATFIGKLSVGDYKHIEISGCKLSYAEWPTLKKVSPVSICDWHYTIDYMGGVEWNFKLKNNSDKTIKYVIMEWNCYNAVGDLIYDSISGNSSHSVKFTGPLDPYETSTSKRNTTLFYNHSYASAKLTRLEVEFMDGTVVKINDQGYYNYIIN